jgi:hypothetical protein
MRWVIRGSRLLSNGLAVLRGKEKRAVGPSNVL